MRIIWRRLGPREAHFFTILALLVAAVLTQALVFGRVASPWLRVELTTILVVYIAVEHFLLPAMVEILFAAVLMHAFSSAPPFFFVMYFVLILAVANLVSRRVALWSLGSQFALFVVMLFLKHALVILMLWRIDVHPNFLGMATEFLPGMVTSCLLAVPMFRLMARIDERFHSSRPHETPTLV